MDLLGLYEALCDVDVELDNLKSRQYTRADIPLARRDEISNEIFKVQQMLLKATEELKGHIENEWL